MNANACWEIPRGVIQRWVEHKRYVVYLWYKQYATSLRYIQQCQCETHKTVEGRVGYSITSIDYWFNMAKSPVISYHRIARDLGSCRFSKLLHLFDHHVQYTNYIDDRWNMIPDSRCFDITKCQPFPLNDTTFPCINPTYLLIANFIAEVDG